MTLLGIISDTHGLFREEVVAALGGCELIIHAGDVGSPMVLDRLRELAPVIAVRGNVDTAPWAQVLPETEVIRIASHSIYVLHDRSRLTLDPVDAGMAAVVFGRTCRWPTRATVSCILIPAAPVRALSPAHHRRAAARNE